MNVFVLAAALMAVVHVVAACSRRRAAIIVSGILWLLYAYYEHQVATGVLCDTNCNIRVDLVFLFPVLGLATYCAYQAYLGRAGQTTMIVSVLGVVGSLVAALAAEGHGYAMLSALALLGALAIVVSALRSRLKINRA